MFASLCRQHMLIEQGCHKGLQKAHAHFFHSVDSWPRSCFHTDVLCVLICRVSFVHTVAVHWMG